jgi:hypothetical protein
VQLIRCVKLEYTFVVGVDRTERRADGNECESCTEVVCSASFGVKDVMTSRVMLIGLSCIGLDRICGG